MTSFEVAIIKPAPPVMRMRFGTRGGPGTKDPTRFMTENASLTSLILRAYALKSWELSAPSWMSTERYNLHATIPEGATKQQFQSMMQNLLAERFHLKVHHEPKEIAIYELTVAKNGPKLKEYVKPTPGPTAPQSGPPEVGPDGLIAGQPGMNYVDGQMRRRAINESMDQFALALSGFVGGPVHNATELTGKYDFDLSWVFGEWVRATPPPQLQHGGTIPPLPDDEAGPTIFLAVRSQLGLNLERKRGKVDVLIVDSADKRPIEN